LHRFDTDQECDGRTDGRTDIWTMAKTREALRAVARKNETKKDVTFSTQNLIV